MSLAGDYGAVMSALWAAHNMGDHVVQTDDQAGRKAAETGWIIPMLGHVGGYTAVQVAALLALRRIGVRPSWWRFVAGVAFSAVTHAVLDRRKPVAWILRVTRSPGFARGQLRIPELAVFTETPEQHQERLDHGVVSLMGHQTMHGWVQETEIPAPLHGPYLADQALHHACLAIAAMIIVGGSDG
jgi:hypothetical protein